MLVKPQNQRVDDQDDLAETGVQQLFRRVFRRGIHEGVQKGFQQIVQKVVQEGFQQGAWEVVQDVMLLRVVDPAVRTGPR